MVERLSVDGLHVEASGRGPLVVLAHGFAGSARNFRPQIRALGDSHRVVVYDARGHARSDAPTGADAYTWEALLRDFGHVVDSQPPQPFVAGGLSLGAATALHYTLAHPERVRGLLLASLPGGGGRLNGGAPVVAFAEAIESRGLEAAGEEFVWGPRSGLDRAAARWVRQGFLEHPPHALARLLRGALAHLPSPAAQAEAARGLDVPTLLVVGERDAPSVASARTLAEALPSAELVEIADAGHVVNLEATAAFDQVTTRWLAALPSGN